MANLRNPNGDVGEAVQCVKLEFRGESFAEDGNLGVISIEMVHETVELVKIVKGMSVAEERRGPGTELWGLLAFQVREMRKGETITGLRFLFGVVMSHLGGYNLYRVGDTVSKGTTMVTE